MENQSGPNKGKGRQTDSSGKGNGFGAIGEERYGTIPIGYDRGYQRGRTTQRDGSPVGRAAPLPGLGMGVGVMDFASLPGGVRMAATGGMTGFLQTIDNTAQNQRIGQAQPQPMKQVYLRPTVYDASPVSHASNSSDGSVASDKPYILVQPTSTAEQRRIAGAAAAAAAATSKPPALAAKEPSTKKTTGDGPSIYSNENPPGYDEYVRQQTAPGPSRQQHGGEPSWFLQPWMRMAEPDPPKTKGGLVQYYLQMAVVASENFIMDLQQKAMNGDEKALHKLQEAYAARESALKDLYEKYDYGRTISGETHVTVDTMSEHEGFYPTFKSASPRTEMGQRKSAQVDPRTAKHEARKEKANSALQYQMAQQKNQAELNAAKQPTPINKTFGFYDPHAPTQAAIGTINAQYQRALDQDPLREKIQVEPLLMGNGGFNLNMYPPGAPKSRVQQLQAQQNATWGALEQMNENVGLIAAFQEMQTKHSMKSVQHIEELENQVDGLKAHLQYTMNNLHAMERKVRQLSRTQGNAAPKTPPEQTSPGTGPVFNTYPTRNDRRAPERQTSAEQPPAFFGFHTRQITPTFVSSAGRANPADDVFGPPVRPEDMNVPRHVPTVDMAGLNLGGGSTTAQAGSPSYVLGTQAPTVGAAAQTMPAQQQAKPATQDPVTVIFNPIRPGATAQQTTSAGPSMATNLPVMPDNRPSPHQFEKKPYQELLASAFAKCEAAVRAVVFIGFDRTVRNRETRELVEKASKHINSSAQAVALLDGSPQERKAVITGISNSFIVKEILDHPIFSLFPTSGAAVELTNKYITAWEAERHALDDVITANNIPSRHILAQERAHWAGEIAKQPGFQNWVKDSAKDLAAAMVDNIRVVVHAPDVHKAAELFEKATLEAMRIAIRMRQDVKYFEFNFHRYGNRWDHKRMVQRNEELGGKEIYQEPPQHVVRCPIAPAIYGKFMGAEDKKVKAEHLYKSEVLLCDRKGNLR